MKIDPRVEEPLRRSFVAVIDHNPDGITPPLEPMNEEDRRRAVGYGVIVVGHVMHDVYGEDADATAAEVMAEPLAERVSEWTDIGSQHDVAAFLDACSRGDASFRGVHQNDIPMMSIICAGYLLGWYTPKGMKWWEYLDQIWTYAESQPDPE